MNNEDKTVDNILSKLFVTTLKIEERSIAGKSNYDLSISELHVLREIDSGGFVANMGQVAAGLKISFGALTTSVSKLENKGYVKRERDKTDKRIVLVMLTEKGQEACKAHEEYHRNMVGAAVGTLTPGEKKVLLKSLIKLEAHFDEEWSKCQE
jgi:DNA-binding MarR family transcriptional regulator